jgi:uncharacterized membrane protein YagU involved in acid resistance
MGERRAMAPEGAHRIKGEPSMARTHTLTVASHDLDWSAVLWAAIIAGVAFMMMEMALVALTGMGGFWGPPRMIAAMLMGKQVLPPPATFDTGIMMVAMLVHFALSIVYAFILAWVIATWSIGIAVLAGAAFGLIVYLVNFYGIAPPFFPWFVEARNWIGLLSHIVFGIVLALAYKAIARPKQA